MTRHRSVDATRREGAYVAWLIRERGYSLKEAIAYATKGQAGLNAMRVAPRPQTMREREEAAEADKGEQLRRWARIDRPCPFKGCIMPIHHSGPHKVVNGLDDPFA